MPSQLQDLALDLEDAPHTYMMWMAWLLAHMPRLRYLSLNTSNELLWMPPLMQLQHLDVHTNGSLAELAKLTNLRTLSICAHADIDMLDLRMLPKLEFARLCISCKKLWVAEQCCVHLELFDANIPNIHDWSNSLASLRSVEWMTKGAVSGQLPTFLTQAHNLRWVGLDCEESIGSKDAPVKLEGAFLHLTWLYVRAKTIHMQLPANLEVDQTVIDAEDALCLSCEHGGRFLECVSAFEIFFKSAVGSFMMELCAEMATRGMAVKIMPLKNGQTNLCHNMSSSQFDDFFECPCGSCSNCLRRAGLVHAEVVEQV